MQIDIEVAFRPRPPQSSYGASVSFILFCPLSFIAFRRNGSVAGLQITPSMFRRSRRYVGAERVIASGAHWTWRSVEKVFHRSKAFIRAGFAGSLNSPGWYRRAVVVGLSCYFS